MIEPDILADLFQAHRRQLQEIAYRMLGSMGEAEDAVQEAWLRLARTDVSGVDNLGAWLRTVVSRVCLDMLRSRATRREELAGEEVPDGADHGRGSNPEQEAILADSVGRALLVVLDTLAPAERVAFVLHDMFTLPFEEIAPIVNRSPVTTKKLASRARLRVRGNPVHGSLELAQHRELVGAFLAASRNGDLDGVLAVLAPDVVRRADARALPADRPAVARGARAVAQEVTVFGRNARYADLALINGAVGIVVAPRGRLATVLTFTIEDGKIAGYEVIADPGRLSRLALAVLDDAKDAKDLT